MKKIFAIILVFCMFACVSGCANNNGIGKSEHKIKLNCPELENISNFVFDKMEKNMHYFTDEKGNIYAINFEKPFFETNTNAKILQDINGFESLLNMQASNNGWFEGSSYIYFIKSQGLNIENTVFFEKAALVFEGKKLNIYEFADIGERYDSEAEKNGNFRLLKEFDEDIISINGCIIKTKSKYYAIEYYITNAADVEKYADVVAKFDYRVVELNEEMFSIPEEDIKFLYMPDLIGDSYFMIDKDNNFYFNKTYIGG